MEGKDSICYSSYNYVLLWQVLHQIDESDLSKHFLGSHRNIGLCLLSSSAIRWIEGNRAPLCIFCHPWNRGSTVQRRIQKNIAGCTLIDHSNKK